jgi:hypothetical protein
VSSRYCIFQLDEWNGWMHVTMTYTKNYDNLIIFSTYPSFMHNGRNLKNNFHWNFVIDDCLYPNLPLCCEINAHMNDIIVQQSIILICKALSHFYNSSKKTKKYLLYLMIIFFDEILHIHKRNHKKQSFQSKFSIFLRSWNLD